MSDRRSRPDEDGEFLGEDIDPDMNPDSAQPVLPERDDEDEDELDLP